MPSRSRSTQPRRNQADAVPSAASAAITNAGAAMIINVMAVPGNGQFNPEGPDAVPTMTISRDEGFMLRDLLATGQKVQISLKLDIPDRRNVPSQNVRR